MDRDFDPKIAPLQLMPVADKVAVEQMAAGGDRGGRLTGGHRRRRKNVFRRLLRGRRGRGRKRFRILLWSAPLVPRRVQSFAAWQEILAADSTWLGTSFAPAPASSVTDGVATALWGTGAILFGAGGRGIGAIAIAGPCAMAFATSHRPATPPQAPRTRAACRQGFPSCSWDLTWQIFLQPGDHARRADAVDLEGGGRITVGLEHIRLLPAYLDALCFTAMPITSKCALPKRLPAPMKARAGSGPLK